MYGPIKKTSRQNCKNVWIYRTLDHVSATLCTMALNEPLCYYALITIKEKYDRTKDTQKIK